MTLLQHLNAVSIERGFRDFSEVLEYPELHVISIIEMAGKNYACECVVKSLERASDNAETETIMGHVFVDKESITNENNIILL